MYEELARVMDYNSEVIDRHLHRITNTLKNHKLHIEALDGTVKRLVKANRKLTTLAIISVIFAFVAVSTPLSVILKLPLLDAILLS